MDRRSVLGITSMSMIGIPALRSLSVAANKKDHTMSVDRKSIEGLAVEYTAAWNTGSPQNVAAYFEENGESLSTAVHRGAGVRVSPRWRPDFSLMFQA